MATLILNPDSADTHFIQLNDAPLLIGSAPDADVHLEDDSLADHCARIEKKPDGFYLISLNSNNAVTVNGNEISFERLNHGDKIAIGTTKAVLLLADEETADPVETAEHEGPSEEFMPVAFAGSNGLTTMPRGPSSCPQCGLPLSPGMTNCPQCGLSLSNLPAMPMGYIPPVPPGQVGPGILPIIAFLAALTVVGAPVALVLGLMSLSAIRKRGGTVRDRALAKWSIGLGLVWLMLGAVAAGGMIKQAHRRKQLNTVELYETKVIRALKNLACAQKYAHTIEAYDTDSDGQGEYGVLDELSEAKSPFFDPELADGEAYGYRFSVREASEGQFLAVAEPLRYDETGIRTFAINQSGQIRGADTEGQRYGQVAAMLPVLQGERNAYYEIDDEIATDVLNYIKALSSSLPDQEKKQRILRRLLEDFALTSVGRELDGMSDSVDSFVSEQHAQLLYQEAKTAQVEGSADVALAKLMEIQARHPSFSEIAAVERELGNLRSMIAQQREQKAQDLFTKAEAMERQGDDPQAVQQLYQRIEKLYPETDVATRVASQKPELQRQMRERSAENIFSDLMELSPESDYEEILNRGYQLRRNYDDTDLFAVIEPDLAEKERKARASSWRFKTEENMQAGRMRGALAQLESAARENSDLVYDLRDLFITLYRNVADTLMEEGDARKALTYYERLNQLLRVEGSEETISADRMAQLHHDVGQADFGKKEYETARWHLASAAWKYQDDAQFSTKLGVANLYLGLYKPARTALNRALAARPTYSAALLYRSYLNLRSALIMEQTLADSFTLEADDPAPAAADPESTKPAADPTVINLEFSDYQDSTELGNALRKAQPRENIEVEGPTSLTLKPSAAGEDWFASFESSPLDPDSAVPVPKDLDLFLGFNYQTSSLILPNFMQYIEGLYRQRAANRTAIKSAAVETDGGGERGVARSQSREQIQKAMMGYRAQLRELSKVHFEDVAARRELNEMVDEMKQRLRAAADDIQAAAAQQPQVRSLTENVLSQINTKHQFLDEADTLISSCMQSEIEMREDILDLAEDILEKDQITTGEMASMERAFSRLKRNLFDEETLVSIDQALRALRESMGVRVDLGNILRAAEKNT